jgi:hypothetical protein
MWLYSIILVGAAGGFRVHGHCTVRVGATIASAQRSPELQNTKRTPNFYAL